MQPEVGIRNVRNSGAKEAVSLALNSLSVPQRKSYQIAEVELEGGPLGNTVERRQGSISGQT